MIRPEALPAFLLAVLVMAASPGPAMALILQRAGLHGFRRAIPTVLGVEVGLLLWALAVGLGLAALVAASEVAFLALKIVGAGFLAYLGIRALRAGWALRDAVTAGALAVPTPRGHAGAFMEGLVVQVANPKAAVFLFAFYPQFLPADGPVLLPSLTLGVIQTGVETVLYLALALVVGRAAAWFQRAAVRRRLQYASGVVLLGLAGRMAVASR